MAVSACYEDEEDPENEYQRIRIEPIYDADSCVFFDLGSKRQDKADAKHCFVLTSYTPEDYKEEWGDDPTSWPKEVTSTEFDWSTPDLVFVAEYYLVEEKKDQIVVFQSPTGGEERYKQSELDADEDLVARLSATGRKEVRRKRIKVKKIHKYLLSGGKVLEDCGYIAGKNIPIVQTYGKRLVVDGVERCMGHVRLAKDAQRLKNMQLSKLGELSAYSNTEKPIFTPEQVLSHSQMWADDPIKNYPYLLVNAIEDANGQKMPSGPIAYTKPPQIPPAMAALLQITEQDMQDILGNPANAEKMVSNIAEKTVEMIHQRLDMQSFIYMSNHAKAVKRGGEIWFSQAQELYTDAGRKMKTVGTHGELGTVELMRPIQDEETSANMLENDLSKAALDAAVEVGPSSSSKRDATVRKLTNMLTSTTDPETQQVLQSMIMLNMEGEGISDVRDYFRMKLVKMGVLKPTDEEAKAMEAAKVGQPEDPNALYLKAAAEEASANATQARVKTVDTLAAAELKRAQTAETMAKVDAASREVALKDAAAAIQQLGARNSIGGQDTILAHINAPEAMTLKRMGGSGRIDPETGAMHFDAGGLRGDAHAGNASGGYDHETRGGNGGWDDTASQNFIDPGEQGITANQVNQLDPNAARAARFGAQGSVDPNAVNAGTAYGINEGPRTHTLANFVQGFKAVPFGPMGRTLAGLGRFAVGDAGTPAVNGGGWSGLGDSGQAPMNAPGEAQPGIDETPDSVGYQPRIPVNQWANMPAQDRHEAMNQFWHKF
jgi:hypothetical protein